jgi:decaprenylphospho-beta-D-erythro-pentofuranosid-2-ulose 2-reductase
VSRAPNGTGPRRVLIVGATSAMAAATARLYAAEGARLYLIARNQEKLSATADDLRVRGAAQVESAVLDLRDTARHAAIIEDAFLRLGALDIALLAHGILPEQARCEADVETTLNTLEVNFSSTVALLTLLANRFEVQGRGCIAVISSVAGDRGRQSNYVYGATKGGLNVFLEGLRNRLFRSGVAVVTLKPGFVDTPMTAGIPKNALFASPATAGRAIYRAIEAGRDVAYIPAFWRLILLVVKSIPESIFKRLRL